MLSDLVTRRTSTCNKPLEIRFIDIKRAHLRALATREISIDLPEEEYEEGYVGVLIYSLYGTIDAAHNCQRSYTTSCEEAGYITGIASACCFYNADTDSKCLVHGDDF